MIRGIINNCEKCKSSYGQYNESKENDFSEYWCQLSTFNENKELKKPKGLCQFCNQKSKYFNGKQGIEK